ncbi:MAG: T9SS type A sorting domain-containing protein [Taibaiella sp.]|nr:T9SS type A sorting domain-containing protein [Taibaiella sp.]
MKRLLLFVFIYFSSSCMAIAQFGEGDTIRINFRADTILHYLPDTSATPLWQVGRTTKSFFTSDTNGIISMMTDTTNNYPITANNFFVIRIPRKGNTIVSFWHKYQTDSAHDGGVVEFSLDHGLSWHNVTDSCNVDSGINSPGPLTGLLTTNFYGPKDTLQSGEPSFNGQCDTFRHSKIRFEDPAAPKSTATSGCYWHSLDTFYLRFRFVSDTIPDSLAGWLIDSIRVNYLGIGFGSVNHFSGIRSLPVSPNPSPTGTFRFPDVSIKKQFTIQVYNTLGQRILQLPLTHLLDISSYPKGLYYYKATDGTEYYSGKLLYE